MNKSDIVFMIAKSGLNVVPYVGGSLASILGDIQSERNQVRLKKFLLDFANEMNLKQKQIVRTYIESEEFLDVFENVLIDIIHQRTEEKRNYLKNLLVNSIITPGTKYADTEEFQRLVNEFSNTHIAILATFYSCRNIYITGDKVETESILKKLEDKKIDFENSYDHDYISYIRDMENQNLINYFTQNYINREWGEIINDDGPYITKKGIAFYQYITDAD